MKTKGDCLALFLRLIDEATKKGVEISSLKNADPRDKFNHFINDAQIYAANIVKIPRTYTVTQNPIPNQLGLLQGFDMRQYLPGKSNIGVNNVLTFTGTKSYYLEIDNVGTITIAKNGVTIQTINNTSKNSFTAYKANTGALSTDIVTFTFSGNYPYNIRNTGFYEYAFPLDADVPVYTPFVAYDMPSDFMKFDNIVIKSDPRIYDAYVSYKWENNKKVILNYYDKGSFDIHYFSYPAEIKATDPDDTPLEIEDKAIDLVVLHAGIKATAADNEDLSQYLQRMFDRIAPNIADKEILGESKVQTVYSMG